MKWSDIDSEERQVLRSLFLPAQAPAHDKTVLSVARRTGLSPNRVVAILAGLEMHDPRLVRKVAAERAGEFWVALPQGRGLLDHAG